MSISIKERVKFLINSNKTLFFAFLLIFFAGVITNCVGYFTNDSFQRSGAEYISSVAKSSSSGFYNIGFTDEFCSNRNDFIDVYNLSRSLGSLSTNRTGYNVSAGFDKNNPFFHKQSEYIFAGESISIICSPFNSVKQDGEHYYHEIWNISTMFEPQKNSSDGTSNFCFIPESIAKALLGKENPSLGEYASLLDTNIQVEYIDKIDPLKSQVCTWKINNIFVEDEMYKYFYSQYGLFFATYLGLPSFNNASINVQFGHSIYYNKTFLQWINQNLPLNIWSIYCGNDYKGFDLSRLELFIKNYNETGLNSSSALIIVSSISLCFLFLLLVFVTKWTYSNKWFFLFVVLSGWFFSCFVIYIGNFFNFSNSPLCFYYSAGLCFLMFLVFLIFKKQKKASRIKEHVFKI